MATEEESAPTSNETGETPAELQAKLEQLKASATQQYSLKNYASAAESYSEAAEVQDQLHGEMSLENADLLYQYGRCLYHVAVANSDVLGGKVAGGDEPKRKKRKVTKENGEGSSGGVNSDALKDGEEKLAEDVVEAVVDEKTGNVKKEEDAKSKPFFQITGDENFTDSEDDEDDENAAEAEAEEEEDDFATAYEVLDMARILLSRKVEATSDKTEKRQLQERLADTHDLQAEISLENERFHDAIKDTRDSLNLKMELYSPESSLIAEAHFKLSLALEFASVTSTSEGGAGADGEAEAKPTQVDEKMRAEAANEMEDAISSCRLRVAKEEQALTDIAETDPKHAEHSRSIVDVKEMVADMEQRLQDLRNPAVSLSGPTGPAGAANDDPVRGILGDLLGESKAEQQKRIAEATSKANDLSGLIKKKKVKVEDAADGGSDAGSEVSGKGKRKANEGGVDGGGKKVKFET